MNRRLLRTSVAGGMVAAFAIAGIGTASADPNPEPGTPPAGKTPSQIYAGVGADAFAELTNNVMVNYNAQSPAPAVVLASYDSINPVADLLQPQRRFTDTQLGMLNAIYSLPERYQTAPEQAASA